jgi:hypothetical protein
MPLYLIGSARALVMEAGVVADRLVEIVPLCLYAKHHELGR